MPSRFPALCVSTLPLAPFACLAGSNTEAWRSQVLLRTRDDSPLVRGRALAAASGLVQALGFEYLGLIPESLPFLAELLEDGEAPLASATQRLIARLEQLSGESLQEHVRAG